MHTISPHQALELTQQHTTLFIDVREPAEYASQRIAGTTLAPLSAINSFEIDEACKDVVVHCKAGMRAQKAIVQLQVRYPDLNFYNIEKGIDGWISNGLATIKGETSGLSLDRQVQLTIGTFVLSGSLLGYFVDAHWFALSGFFGAGLLFAGLSGTCGLGMLIARMPWNQK